MYSQVMKYELIKEHDYWSRIFKEPKRWPETEERTIIIVYENIELFYELGNFHLISNGTLIGRTNFILNEISEDFVLIIITVLRNKIILKNNFSSYDFSVEIIAETNELKIGWSDQATYKGCFKIPKLKRRLSQG